MSHSQFHSTDLFILRHAWLNLWDKHMTTGRINQVSYKCAQFRLLRPRLAHTQIERVFTWDTHNCFAATCV